MRLVAWSLTFGSVFLFAQSYALSIQNIEINSALGQPLDAVVHISAARGESLRASCITIHPGSDAALPAIRGVQLSLSRNLNPGTLRLRSRSPMREPMSELVVRVNCPGAPKIQRSFLVMLDPVQVADGAPAYAQNTPARTALQTSGYAVSSSDNRIRVVSSSPLSSSAQPVVPGGRYMVANGESLSTIAARVEGRASGTVWSWAATIQNANPQAFLNGDPNNLLAGFELYIPGAIKQGLSIRQIRNGAQTESAVVAQSDSSTGAGVSVSDSNERGLSFAERSLAAAVQQEQARTIQDTPNAMQVPQNAAIGMVATAPDTFMMATRFSRLSMARLEQRKAGLIQALPVGVTELVNKMQAKDAPPEQEQANDPAPVVPSDPKPAAAVVTSTVTRRVPWMQGIGLMLVSFLAGFALSSRRNRQKAENEHVVDAHEARFRERVKNDHQSITARVLGAITPGSGIVVSEGPADHPAAQSQPAEPPVTTNTAGTVPTDKKVDNDFGTTVTEIEDVQDPLNPSTSHTLTTIDLELLEQDYAAQEKMGLEDIANAGQGNQTELINARLDLELPNEFETTADGADMTDSINFSAELPSLDFDIGDTRDADHHDELTASTEVHDAGAEFDAALETFVANELEPEATDSIDVEFELDDEQFTATSTRDSEEFYHLETSSIMDVDELAFEQELEDETKILNFRQRSLKTGTDDANNDDE
ncbi:MAG: hypothetical protein HKN70_09040 [Gammaproteobacteria bacterium]|nr:hypothetical protein [Gammaproteobacteria bacterium]